jgi:hypothetical protein
MGEEIPSPLTQVIVDDCADKSSCIDIMKLNVMQRWERKFFIQ